MANVNKLNIPADGMKILNAIKTDGSAEYNERIPWATRYNIAEVGNSILKYEHLTNEFLRQLINRIGLVMITNELYTNPYGRFKKRLNAGDTVEELFVELAKAFPYNAEIAEENVERRVIPDVRAAFHRIDRRDFYKITVQEEELRRAFLSYDGVYDLVSKIIESVYTSAEYDEFLLTKDLFRRNIESGRFYPVKVDTPVAANATALATAFRSISNQLTFMSRKFNWAKVHTFTPRNRQLIFITADFDAIMDVNVLASAFNMDRANFLGQRILIDNFGEGLEDVVAAVVDERWFMIFDYLSTMRERENGEGLYRNYWYHVWQVWSSSPFANAILFTTADSAVTSVAVEPATASVMRGKSAWFTENVDATGYADSSVIWSIDAESKAKGSYIESNGNLFVGNKQLADDTITVTATSGYDSTKKGTATVTVLEKEPAPPAGEPDPRT